MLLRLTCVPRDPDSMAALARSCERHGLDGLGVADSPHLHGATYPIVQHVLGRTATLRAGPFVTNPVTRHPSVHAADLDTLDVLFPGRLFAGLGTGDSAVTSVGLRAATPDQLAASITTIHDRVGERVPVSVAVGGQRAAAATPTGAAAVVLGSGLDTTWSRRLATSAEQAAGHPLERWGFLVASLGPEDEREGREQMLLGSVLTVARHALMRDMSARGVPDRLHSGLADLFAAYDVRHHGATGGANHALLRRYPEHCGYLLDRFAVLDGSHDTLARLSGYAVELGLTGFYLSATVPDQQAHVRHIGAELVPGLRRPPRFTSGMSRS